MAPFALPIVSVWAYAIQWVDLQLGFDSHFSALDPRLFSCAQHRRLGIHLVYRALYVVATANMPVSAPYRVIVVVGCR